MNECVRKPNPIKEMLPGWSDERLVSGLRASDGLAAEVMVRTHGGWMHSVARRILRDDALAKDCVQEAFVNAFRKIGDFEERSSLKSWLHRIVVNQALMKLRARRNPLLALLCHAKIPQAGLNMWPHHGPE